MSTHTFQLSVSDFPTLVIEAGSYATDEVRLSFGALLVLIAWCTASDRRVADGLSYYRPV